VIAVAVAVPLVLVIGATIGYIIYRRKIKARIDDGSESP
jgi:uncharacterized protein YneF (UPF0154 family)